ncbi:MAG TPA: helix-turn-helix transcriptional regulator [Eoetvoesiella sp.]
MNSFAERLRQTRRLRGLSQADLAKASDVSQGAIANYELGIRRQAKNIFKIANVLKVNALWLGEGIGPMELEHSTAPLTSYELTDPRPTPNLSVWPFQDISPDEYWALGRHQRTTVERTVIALIASLKKQDSN